MSEHEAPSHHHHDDQTELEKLFRNSKPWFEENGTVLIYAVAAFMAIAAIYVYVNRTPPSQVEASRDLLLAVTPEEFRDVADAYPDTEIGTWARLRQADRLLDDAVTNMFTNREEGAKLLEQADVAYIQLVERPALNDQVRERVLIGLARIAETRCDGGDATTKTAIDAWKRVLNEYQTTLVKEHAESRVAELATEKSKAFYAWFYAQNPSPNDPGMAPGQPQVPQVPGFEGLGLDIPAADPAVEEGAKEMSEPAKAEADTQPAKPADESSDKAVEETPAPSEPAKPAIPDATTAEPVKEEPAVPATATPETAAEKTPVPEAASESPAPETTESGSSVGEQPK